MLNLLIVGAPRSGTSLLCALLAQQDGIALVHEDMTLAWRRQVGHDVIGVKLCIPNQIVLGPLRGSQRILLYSRARLYEILRKRVSSRVRKPIMPGKMTIRDFQEFENWKIIATVRDPEEVITSIQSRGGQPLKEAFRRYRAATLTIHCVWSEQRDRVDLVDFDCLVRRPVEVIGDICDRLGVIFDEGRIDGNTPNYRQSVIDSRRSKQRDFEDRLRHGVFDGDWELTQAFRELAVAAREL